MSQNVLRIITGRFIIFKQHTRIFSGKIKKFIIIITMNTYYRYDMPLIVLQQSIRTRARERYVPEPAMG